MKDIRREDISIVSRHSNLGEPAIARLLKENIYPGKTGWKKFLRLLFITLGAGFTVSGVIFFFAYNWASLHRFFKLALIEGLVIVTVSLLLFAGLKPLTKKILLTAATAFTGVLFAVFGQVYQTGANAYDLFLGWTIFVTPWVLVAGFAPLWVLYLLLFNTTLNLYADQVANNWPPVFVFGILYFVHAVALLITIYLSRYGKAGYVPAWFRYTVALAAFGYATLGIVVGIFDSFHWIFPVLLLVAALLFISGFGYGLRARNTFYLSIVPFCLIIIVSAWLINISDGELTFLLVGLFIVVSVTLSIKNLVGLQKKWANEK